jgi:polar amino acid transport system substrate-binding protein
MRRTGWRGGRAAAVAWGVATALVLAGCGQGGRAADDSAQQVRATRQAGAAKAPADVQECVPPKSYRPAAGGLPRPGHMPAGSTMDRIVKRGRIIASVDQNAYLFGYRNPLNGRLEGFDIDILHRISEALFGDPNRIEYRTMSSGDRIASLIRRDDPVDIVVHSMTINCERWKQVAFSTNYLDTGQRVLVAQDSPAKSIDDLAGKRVCAVRNTTSITELKRHPVIPVEVEQWTDCLMRMQIGTVDAASTDDNILYGLKAQDPTTKLIGKRFTDEPHGIAMRPAETDFVRFVNGVLDQMRADGSWMALYRKYLAPEAGNDVVTAPPVAEYRD